MTDNDLAEAFLARSRTLLVKEYLNKVRICLDELAPVDLWWRPNPYSNCVGNLLLHLNGNVGQWIIHGVGGAPDTRRRQDEFATCGGASAEELFEHLHATVLSADVVLKGLTPEDLAGHRRIQGLEVTVLQAAYHAVEHFSTHVGQLIYITKLRTGRDLRFYALNAAGGVSRGWLGE